MGFISSSCDIVQLIERFQDHLRSDINVIEMIEQGHEVSPDKSHECAGTINGTRSTDANNRSYSDQMAPGTR